MNDRAEIQIQAQWIIDPGFQPSAANQMIVQDGMPNGNSLSSEIYVTFGHVNPPIFDNPDAAIGAVVPVLPVARLLMSRERLTAFHALIGAHLNAEETTTK